MFPGRLAVQRTERSGLIQLIKSCWVPPTVPKLINPLGVYSVTVGTVSVFTGLVGGLVVGIVSAGGFTGGVGVGVSAGLLEHAITDRHKTVRYRQTKRIKFFGNESQ